MHTFDNTVDAYTHSRTQLHQRIAQSICSTDAVAWCWCGVVQLSKEMMIDFRKAYQNDEGANRGNNTHAYEHTAASASAVIAALQVLHVLTSYVRCV